MSQPSIGLAQETVRQINIRAERFTFEPRAIEVVAGQRVRLLVEAVDVPHGIGIAGLGVEGVARPGAEPTVLEFLADRPGRYRFVCTVFCGVNHGEMLGELTVISGSENDGSRTPDDQSDDRAVDVLEPDFQLVTLPTTLRIPHKSFAFRLTHRFSRPLDAGPGYGNLLEDFFGFDSPAFIGLELRYGVAPGTQVTVYRNNNRNIQLSGKYNLLRANSVGGVGLDAYVAIEGMNNFRQDYSPVVGMIVSKRVADRATLYAQPMWIGNTNKLLLHPETNFRSDSKNALLAGLGARLRVRGSTNVIVESAPRVAGFANGQHQLSFAIEKVLGGHVFQVNVSNGLGSSPAQIAGGATENDWFIGFNIARRFY
jgi:plastocyanin